MFQKKLKTFINESAIVTNIFRKQAYDSIMCRYFCIGFIDLVTYITNLFSTKNDDIILNYFMTNV